VKRIKVNLGERSYPIVIGHQILTEIGPIIKRLNLGRDAAIITNPKIWSLCGPRLKRVLKEYSPVAIKVPDSETSKSNRQVVRIIESIVKIDKGRGIFIVALGGGVVGDVAGFVASIYKRGVPYIQIPTTLLAQVDSAIGGKVAIDLTSAKNLVGAFYQPRLVISDTNLLKSLPRRQIRSGLAEIIKYGIIKDTRLFVFLEENIGSIQRLNDKALEYIISRSSAIKAQVVHLDEYDKKGIRACLNYGHTIGHALEAAAKYSKLYSHGEAIATGMVAAAKIALKTGVLDDLSVRRITNLIKMAGLPVKISKKLRADKIMKAQTYDKKIIRGVNRFVLPTNIGKVKVYEDIPRSLILDVVNEMRKGD
jgi:3-dehydroquinate synthase